MTKFSRRLAVAAGLAAAGIATSCQDDLGPEDPRIARFAVAPFFESERASIVTVTQAIIQVRNRQFNTVVAEEVVPVTSDTVDTSIDVPYVDVTQTFDLYLYLLGATGDTVFQGGPIEVQPSSAGGGTAPVPVPIAYVGPGSKVDSVAITNAAPMLWSGTSFSYQATAWEGSTVVPNTPISWFSLDSSIAQVPDDSVGTVVAGTQRGTARIVAQTLTNQADTAQVVVQPRPSAAQVPAGDTQSGEVLLSLPTPVTIRVVASDGMGVERAVVRFAGDGTFSPDTAVTDANGEVTTTWTLGAVSGTQTGTATVDDQPASMVLGDSESGPVLLMTSSSDGAESKSATHVSVNFTATALAGPATGLAFTQQPMNTTAGAANPVSVALVDSVGNVVSTDTGTPVTLSISSGTGTQGASILGLNPSLTVSGVAAFADMAIDLVGTNYQLIASGTGLAPDTSAAFDIMVGVLSVIGLTPSTDTLTALGDTALFTPSATDSLGNPVPGTMFTWSSSDSSVAIPDSLGNTVAIGNGTAFISAASGGTAGSATIVVQQAVSSVAVTPSNATITSIGGTQQFMASGTDANGNPVAGAVFTWSLSDSSVASVDSAGLTTSVANGVTTVTATSGGASGNATLTVGQTPTQLVFTTPPATSVAGDTIPVTVEVQDSAGVAVSTFVDSVDIAIGVNPSGAQLNGTTRVAAVGGVVAFTDLFITAADTGYTLNAQIPSFLFAASGPFDITPDSAVRLQFTVEPTAALQGDTIAPAVEVSALDAYANVDTSFTNTMTVGILTNPGGSVLSGTLSVPAVAGVATFADLSLDQVGVGYELSAVSLPLAPDTSAMFDIGSQFTGGVHWINPAGGNWSDAASWSTGTVPTATDSAFIDASGTYTVTLDQAATVAQLHVGGASGVQTLDINGNTMTVDSLGTLAAGDSIHQGGGTFGGNGFMTVDGAWHWSGGAWADSGATFFSATSSVTTSGASTLILSTRLLQIGGAFTWANTNQLQLQSDAIVSIQAGVTVDWQTDANFGQFAAGAATVTNAGTFLKSGGVSSTVFTIPYVDSPGSSIDIQAGEVHFSGLNNTVQGALTIASGTEFRITGGSTILLDGVTTAPSPAGRVRVTGGTLSAGVIPNDTVSLGLLQVTGGTVTGGGNLTVTDSLLWTGGTMAGATGSTFIAPGAVFRATTSGTMTLDGRSLFIAGTVEWAGTGAPQLRNNASVTIGATGVWDFSTDADFLAFNPGTAFVQNDGILRKSGGGLNSVISVPFQNNPGALLDIQTGEIELIQSSTIWNTSTVTIANGSFLELGGGTQTFVDGFSLAPAPAGRLRMRAGLLEIGTAPGDTVTLPGIDFVGGTIQGPGVLMVTNDLTLTGGTFAGTGTTHIATGAQLLGNSSGTRTIDARTIEIAGGATWTGAGSPQLRNNATLHIQSSGTWDWQTDADFDSFNPGTASVINDGLIQKTGGTGQTVASVPFNHNVGAVLDVQVGSFLIRQGSPFNGTVTIGTGATLDIDGGTTVLPDGFATAPTPAGRIAVTGGALQIGNAASDTVTIPGLDFNSGTILGSGVLMVPDTLVLSGGTFSGSGVTHVPGGGYLIGTSTGTRIIDGRTLEIAGTAEWTGPGAPQLRNNASLHVLATGVWDWQNDSDFQSFNPGTATVINDGTIQKSGGTGITQFTVPLIHNAGASLDIQTGTFRFDVGLTPTGAITIATGALMHINGGTTVLPGGFALAPTPAGRLTVSTGTVEIGTATTDTVVIPGLNFGSGTIQGPGVLMVPDTLLLSGGTFAGSGVTHTPAGAFLLGTSSGTRIIDGRTMEIAGTAEWTGAGHPQLRNNATLHVQAGGLWDMQTDSDFTSFNPGTASVINDGTIQKSGGTGVTQFSVPLIHPAGAILDVQSGRFQIDAGTTFDGTVTIAGGAFLNLNGGTTVFPNGFATAGTPNGRVVMNGGVMQIGSAAQDVVNIPGLNFNGGSLTGPGTLVVADTMAWANGSLDGSGVTRIEAGAFLLGTPTGTRTMDTRTLEVAGTVEWTGNGSPQLRNNSSIDIQATGVWDFQSDADFASFNPGTANVNNDGVLVKSAGGGITQITVPFTSGAASTVSVETGTIQPVNTFTTLPGATLRGTGTLNLAAATGVTLDANVEPGASPGILGWVGDYQPGSVSTLHLELEGVTAGNGPGFHDQLNILGAATLDGTLVIDTANGFVPGTDTLPVMTFTSRAGAFGSVIFPAGIPMDTLWTSGQSPDTLYVVTSGPSNQNRWTNASGGNWTDPSNWSLNRIPAFTDTVTIDTPGTYTVIMDINAAANRLVIGGASGTQTLQTPALRLLTIGSGGFYVAPNGVLDHSGAFNGATPMTIDGTFDWSDGTLGGGVATIDINPGATFNVLAATSKNYIGKTFNLNGTMNIIGSDLSAGANSHINIGSTGVLDFQADFGIPGTTTPRSITNNGVIQKTGGPGTSTVDVPTTNANLAVIDVQSGTLAPVNTFDHQAGALIQGTGTLDLSSATVGTWDGDVGPGASPGILALTGALSPGAPASVLIELEGPTAGNGPGFYDRLNVSGTVTFGGTLAVDTANLYAPSVNDSFAIMTFGSRVGNFAAVTLPNITGVVLDTAWTSGQSPDTLYVVAGPPPPPNLNRWVAAGGGFWSNPANWSKNAVPVLADSVVIDNGGTYTVNLNQAATVAYLNLGTSSGGQTLAVTNQNLTITGGGQINSSGRLTASGTSVVDVSGTLTVDGIYDHSGGTLTGTGTLLIQNTLNIGAFPSVGLTGVTIDIPGVADWNSGDIDAGQGARINVLTGGSFQIANAGAGDFLFNQGGARPIIDVQAGGSFSAGGSNKLIEAQVDVAGTMSANTATTSFNGGGSTSGIWQTTNSQAVYAFGGLNYTFGPASSFTSTGSAQFDAGTVTFQNGYAVTNTTTVNGGTVEFSNGGASTTGILTLNSGTVGGSDTLVVNAASTWASGTIGTNAGGTVRIVTSLTASGVVAKALDGHSLINEGAFTYTTTSPFTLSNGAIIRNQSGATVDIQDPFPISDGGGAASQIINDGTWEYSGTGVLDVNQFFTNTDSVHVAAGGALRLINGGNSTGTIFAADGGQVEFFNGHTVTGGVAGGGSVLQLGGTTVFSGTYAVDTTLVLGGRADFDIAGPDSATTNELRFTGGELGGTGLLHVTTGGIWDDGNFIGTGTTRFGPAATFNIQTAANRGLDARTLDNEGTVNWPATGTITGSNGAAFNNQPNATLAFQDGGRVDQGAGAQTTFTNNGLVLRTGFNNFVLNAAFDNNDSVDVANPGGLELLGGGTSSGIYTISTNGTLIFAGGHALDSVLGGAGFVTFGIGVNTVTGGYDASGGTTTLNGGLNVFNTADTTRFGRLLHSAGILGGTAPVVLSQPGVLAGFFNSGAWQRSGSIHLAPGATFDYNNAAGVLDTADFFIEGTVNWLSGTLTASEASATTVQPGARIDIFGPGAFNQGTNGASLSNGGTIQRGGTVGVFTFGVDYANTATGLTDLVTGDIAWTGTFDHAAGAVMRGHTTNDLSAATVGTFDGDVDPGQGIFPGLMGYTGNFAAGAPSSLDIQLDGKTPGTGGGNHDQFIINGAFNGGGTLNVVGGAGYVPAAGDSLIIMTFTSRGAGGTANFSAFTFPNVSPNVPDTVWTANALAFVVRSPAPPNLNRWLPAGNGNWNDPNNWSKTAIPVAGDSVVIDQTPAGYTVTLDLASVTIDALNLGDPMGAIELDLNGNTLTVGSGGSIINAGGVLSHNGGTLNLTGTLTNNGNHTFDGGTIGGAGTGTLNVGQFGAMSTAGAGNRTLDDITISNDGSWTHTMSGDLVFANGTAINVTANGAMVFPGGGSNLSQGVGAAGSIVNGGLFERAAAGTIFVAVPITNNDSVHVQTGSLRFNAGGSGAGAYRVENGAQLLMAGATHTVNGTVTGDGTFQSIGSVQQFNGPFVMDTVILNGGTPNFNGTMPDSAVANYVSQTTASLQGTGLLHVTTTYDWIGGSFLGAGTLRIGPAATLNVSTATARNWSVRTIDNEGTVAWPATATVTATNATLVNQPAGVVDLQGATGNIAFGGGTNTFTNNGTLQRTTGAGVFQLGMDVAHGPGAGLDVQTGTLDLTQTATFGEDVSVSAGATLALSGGATSLYDGFSATGLGVVSLTGGSVTNAGGQSAGFERLTVAAGQIDGDGTIDVDSLGWTAGDISSPGGSGTTTANNFFTVSGAGLKQLDGRTLVNAGAGTWTATGTVNTSNGATLRNAATGTLDLQSTDQLIYSAGATPQFVNDGTLEFTGAGGVTFTVDMALTNNDSIDLTGAGTLEFSEGGSGTGVVSLTAGTMEFSGGSSVFNMADSLIGNGGVLVSGGTATFTGRVDSIGTIGVAGGTANWNNTLDTMVVENLSLSTGTLAATGAFRVKSSGAWTDTGTWGGTGSTHIDAGATFTASATGTRDLDSHTIDNEGTMNFTSAATVRLGNGAHLDNNVGGVINISDDLNLTGTTGGGSIDNNGTMNRTTSTGTATVGDPVVSVTNDGTIDVQTGTLNLQAGGLSTGTFTVQSAATLDFTDPTNNYLITSAGGISGTGRVRTNTGVQLEILGSYGMQNTTISAGAILFSGGATLATTDTLIQIAGEVSGTDTLVVNTLHQWQGGAQATGGQTRIAAGATLDMLNNATYRISQRELMIEGTANYTGGVGGGQLQSELGGVLRVANGGVFTMSNNAESFVHLGGARDTVIIDAGGTFNYNVAATRTFDVAFDISGTLNIQAGTLSLLENLNFQSGGLVSGVGTWDLSSATVQALNGDFAPGGANTAGTLSITGALPATATGTYFVELGGTAGGQHDVLAVSGGVDVTGMTLSITTISAHTPSQGNNYNFLTTGSPPATDPFAVVSNLSGYGPGFNVVNSGGPTVVLTAN